MNTYQLLGFIVKCAMNNVDPVDLIKQAESYTTAGIAPEVAQQQQAQSIPKPTSAQPVGTGQQQQLSQSTTATPIPPPLSASTTAINSKIRS